MLKGADQIVSGVGNFCLFSYGELSEQELLFASSQQLVLSTYAHPGLPSQNCSRGIGDCGESGEEQRVSPVKFMFSRLPLTG